MASKKTRMVKPWPTSVAVRCEVAATAEMGIECKTSQWADYLDPRVSGYGATEAEAIAAWKRRYIEVCQTPPGCR